MSIGYKKKDSNGPLYHPERDFAYITPTLMRQAIENLEAPTAELRVWKEQQEITEAEIVKAAEALADSQRDFVNGSDPVASLEQALERHSWSALRLPVRLYALAEIGQVIVGAWFKAVREITEVGEESPAQNEMCRFTSTVREFAARIGAPVIDSNSTAENLLFQCDLLRARLALLHEERTQWRASALAAEQQIEKLQKLHQRPWWKKLFGNKEV